MGHRYVHPGLGGFRNGLAVLAQPSAPAQPSQGPFHHPTPGQYQECVLAVGAPDYFQRPPGLFHHPIDQLPSVAVVRPEQTQAVEPSCELADNQSGSVPVLDVGGVNHHGQEQPHGVHRNVALASRHLLAGVVASNPLFSVS